MESYETLQMEVLLFDAADVIVTSNGDLDLPPFSG